MKALTIRQPWAWLIVNGFKTIENRSWRTHYRGPLLIHAAKAIDRAGYDYVRLHHPEIPLPAIGDLQVSGIIGQCDVTGCVEESSSPWFFGPMGFTLENATTLPFHPMSGKLGMFNVEEPSLSKSAGAKRRPQARLRA